MKTNRRSFGRTQESVYDLKTYGWGVSEILEQ